MDRATLRNAADGAIRTNPVGNSGSREGEIGSGRGLGSGVRMAMLMDMAVRAAGLAGPDAGAERLVDDALDGTRATAAFGAAAKAAIDLLGVTRKAVGRIHGVADVVIAQHVAGADNH
jgi:hypothetical protein